MPVVYRRSVINDTVGKAGPTCLTTKIGKRLAERKASLACLGQINHPVLYKGTIELEIEKFDRRDNFVAINVYDGQNWIWAKLPGQVQPVAREKG